MRWPLYVDWCSKEAAQFAAKQWHYTGKIPNQKLACVGVWEHGAFVGSVMFGDGACKDLLSPFGLGADDGCELVRVALTKHRSAVSKIVSRSLSLLRARFPHVRIVVSFADPDQGHVGGIYQALGWVYTGMTKASDEYIVNGRRMHGRALRATRRTHPKGGHPSKNVLDWARAVLDRHARPVAGSAKHRYVCLVDRRDADLGDLLRSISLPYPKKRAGSIGADAPAVQAGEGGSQPTPALHSQEASHA